MERKDKKSISKNLLKGTLIAGALISVTSLSAATTSSLFDYDTMGSGSEVRSELLDTPSTTPMNNFEMKCGEAEKEAKTDSTKVESKSKEAKCGEGKCGDKKKDAKVDSTKAESKSKEAKCGEGKCGN